MDDHPFALYPPNSLMSDEASSILLRSIHKISLMPNEASGSVASLARRGVKGRKSLAGCGAEPRMSSV